MYQTKHRMTERNKRTVKNGIIRTRYLFMANNVWKNLSSCWLPRLIALRPLLFHNGNGKPDERENGPGYIIELQKGPVLKVLMS